MTKLSDEFKNFLSECYEDIRLNTEGETANYIPQLEKVNPELFGISICTVDGNRFDIGDTEIDFCIQSCSKPITYCIAQDVVGERVVHEHIGHEPSGRRFNAFVLDENEKPHNPMINAGAIMTCALIEPTEEPSERYDFVKKYLQKLTGNVGSLGFDNSVYLSEKTHANRNFALAYFMNEVHAFPESTDLEKTLELYFQLCSILSNTRTLSVLVATLANGGICPLTDEKVFEPQAVKNCLSLMYSCGMYDYSGKFAFEIGLPAKSGVSGCLFLVVPRKMGICIWSPRLDKYGNSVRGVEFCKALVDHKNYHIFDRIVTGKRDESESNIENPEELFSQLFISAASRGELEKVKRYSKKNIDLNTSDYDKRTALHLSSAEDHIDTVKYLLDNGADPLPKDRWGNTPYSEAVKNNNGDIIQLFREYFPEEVLSMTSCQASPSPSGTSSHCLSNK